ncbi:MAG: hypothetical protein JWN04_504 [Myxococcaceae bacterium]|nr:hypothetical protein [Myxococcaceae bacterium]
MNRRTLLKGLGAAGLLLGGVVPARRARADAYAGPVLLTIQASGGWDPTMFCDGKTPNDALQLSYRAPQKIGSVTCAPLQLSSGSVVLDDVPSFFTDLRSRLLVINGIDTQTNSHIIGQKRVWSGTSADQGPALAALFAAANLGQLALPASYISLGGPGYDANAGLVQVARLNSTQQLSSLASPNATSGVDCHDPAAYALIQDAINARLQRAMGNAGISTQSAALAGLSSSRAATSGLKVLADRLAAAPVTVASAFPKLANLNDRSLTSYLTSAQTALTAFACGVSASANITTASAGFDTHSNHDQAHGAEMGRLLLMLRYVFQLSDQLGLADRLYVVVGSDFGRTPTYNANKGKDHWNVTSMLLSGPGIQGDRVIGGTDEQLRPMRVAPNDPSKLLAYDDPNGVTLLPEHIHRSFRLRSGMTDAAVVSRYALTGLESLDHLV